MISDDVRWKQRFENFEKSFNYLEEALQIKEPDIIQRAGIIQFFEMTFELGWNLLKDYLEDQGFTDIKSPRTSIKKAFEIELISDGHRWLDALEDRNLASHTYDEVTAVKIESLIRNNYYPLLKELYNSFKNK